MAQIAANSKRQQVLAQISAAREALEEEEQRLLEEVHREEERVEQCLLTHRAHWSQALENLSQTRSSLVHMLTQAADAHLAVRSVSGIRADQMFGEVRLLVTLVRNNPPDVFLCLIFQTSSQEIAER